MPDAILGILFHLLVQTFNYVRITGYFRKRFSEEHAFGMLIAKYWDEVTDFAYHKMAAKDVLSRLVPHNLHTFRRGYYFIFYITRK